MAGEKSVNRPQKAARILVVDDHPMMRERLAEVINGQPDMCVSGEAEDHHQALEAINAAKPDLAIVDLQLKHSDGLDLIKDIVLQHPGLRILVVSMHDELLYAERALCAGAHGYIAKQQATKDILVAIRTVLANKVHMSPSLANRLASGTAPDRRPPPTRFRTVKFGSLNTSGRAIA